MSEDIQFKHKSVLLEEVIEELDLKPDGIYVDGTLGGAGHSSEMLRRAEIKKLIGIDQDPDAIKAATKKLGPYGERAVIVKSNYENIGEIIKSQNIDKVDGILLDLGVSSYQLDTPDRGFSYMSDAPLDMRMDTESVKTASDIINDYSEQELFKIIRDYGASIPAKVRETGGHPSKRTFQAIRIELNRELEVLENSIGEMIDLLNDKGRLCIITFHSLEDRIVKAAFNTAERPCVCPPGFPVCVCGRKSKGKHLTKKAILPTEEEMEENPRSKSAKLRVFERVI